jgi:anti-sigma regulatory factor (Ser/Thr protein kinase)
MRASIGLRSKATELIRLEAFAEAFARDCGLADDERARLLVILEELFTNVVAHGHAAQFTAGNVAVALGRRRGRLTIDFVDDGPPFDPLAHPRPDLDTPAEQRLIGGLGIAIVRALVDRARYRRKGDCNHLRLVRRLARAEKNVTRRDEK